MHELATSNQQLVISRAWLFPVFYFLIACVETVQSLGETIVKAVQYLATCPQVVFATQALGTNQPVIHVFPGELTQAFTQGFSQFNSSDLVVVPVIHSTSNKGN